MTEYTRGFRAGLQHAAYETYVDNIDPPERTSMIHTKILNDIDDRVTARLNETASPPVRHSNDLLVAANTAELAANHGDRNGAHARNRLVDLAAITIEHIAAIDRATA